MKIIFDNEKQKEKILTAILRETCPREVGFADSDKDEDGCCIAKNCMECWKNCGIEMEVKNDE
jgi:hypothetical protein